MIAEVKASRTATPAMAQGVARLAGAVKGYRTESVVIHRPARETPSLGVLAPGVRATTVDGLLDRLQR